jgi:hypothetical protein
LPSRCVSTPSALSATSLLSGFDFDLFSPRLGVSAVNFFHPRSSVANPFSATCQMVRPLSALHRLFTNQATT